MTEGAPARGSCLCGQVSWQVQPPYRHMLHCHCSMCRKAHGAAFATYLILPAARFAWIDGQSSAAVYRSSPGYRRRFCPDCGSVVPSAFGTDEIAAPAGCLDDDPGMRPDASVFCASAAGWHPIGDELPRYDTWPQDISAPVVKLPPRAPGASGHLQGSCLCAASAFQLTGPFRAVHNCHCRRCRKARAAAHTTNGFVLREHLEYLRGTDLLVRYRVPEAEDFTHTFCSVCGSGMPNPNAQTAQVSVPLGSLDGEPGGGAQDHIYTRYKAPWFEITDGLPRFAEAPPG